MPARYEEWSVNKLANNSHLRKLLTQQCTKGIHQEMIWKYGVTKKIQYNVSKKWISIKGTQLNDISSRFTYWKPNKMTTILLTTLQIQFVELLYTSDAPCWNTGSQNKIKYNLSKEIKALCCDEFSIPNDINIGTNIV